jgi:hypothetical protein
MRAAELLELGRLPSAQSVGVGQRLDHPGVDGETFQAAETEERDAGGHLRTDARQGLEFGGSSRRIQRGELLGPARAGEASFGRCRGERPQR